jgi:hypothetical protein
LDALDGEEVIDALKKIVVALEGHPAPKPIRADEPIRSGHLEKRTAAQPAEASKKGGEIASPSVRRMRIEWD